MDKILELKRQQADTIERAEEIINKAEEANRDLTDEERKLYNEEMKRAEDVKARIERLQQVQAARAALGDPNGGGVAAVLPTGDAEPRVTRDASKNPFRCFGEQLIAIARAGRPGGSVDHRLLGMMEEEARAAGTGVNELINSEGGFLVGADYIFEPYEDMWKNDEFLSRVTRRTLSSNSNQAYLIELDESSRANGSRHGGIQFYTKAELAALTETRPKFKVIEFNLDKLTGLCYVSSEMLEDASFLEGEINDLFDSGLRFKLQDLMFRGTGVGQPLGILNAGCKIEVAKEDGQAADTVKAENIIKMYSRRLISRRDKALWVMNQEVEAELDMMTLVGGTASTPVYMPPGGLADLPYGRIKGIPAVSIEQAAALGDVGDISLLDLSQYVFVDKGSVRQAMSIHLKFDYDQTAFRYTYRCDGRLRRSAALTPYKATSGKTLSPVVMLEAR